MSTSASDPPPGRRRAQSPRWVELATEGAGATRVELFLDLVFVYAFFATTNLMEERFGPGGLFEGLLVVLLLIRCWAGYLLLGNIVRLNRGIMPPLVFGAAGLILLLGVAAPVTFADRPGGLYDPLTFVVAFVLARLSAIVILIYAAGDTRPMRGPGVRALLPLCASGSLLLCGALLPEHLPPGEYGQIVRISLFLSAAVVDFLARRALTAGSWPIVSVRHWVERHRLIVLIALGETVISVGTARGLNGGPPITWAVIVGSALSIVVVAVLWWRYFDIAGLAAEQAVERQPEATRSRFGRDAYSFSHLPMIIGLVLLSLGLKRALSSVEPATAHRWDTLSTLVLYGGAAVFLLGVVALERNTIRLWGRGPLLGIALTVGLAPIAPHLPATAAVGLLAIGLTGTVLADLTLFRRRHRALHELVAPTLAEVTATGATPVRFFFELVIVYAFLQVTVLMTRHPPTVGVVQGLAVLALLWWAYCLYTQLADVFVRESPRRRLAVSLLVALLLVIGIATPQAFDRVPGGLPGPLIVVTCYIAVRARHIIGLWLISRHDPTLHTLVRRSGASALVTSVLLLAAALSTSPDDRLDELDPLVVGLWIAAIVVDLTSGYLAGHRYWQVRSARHWADSYALIVAIALGEAIISTGVAFSGNPISWSAIIAIGLGMALLSTLGWAYLDTNAVAGQQALERHTGARRAALARDAYVYLHFPMITGLILVAFGLRKTFELITASSGPTHPLPGHVILFAGVVSYLLANEAFWWRTRREIRWLRIIGILLTAVLAAATNPLPPLWALALLAAVNIAVVVLDARWAADLRRGLHEPPPPGVPTGADRANPTA